MFLIAVPILPRKRPLTIKGQHDLPGSLWRVLVLPGITIGCSPLKTKRPFILHKMTSYVQGPVW